MFKKDIEANKNGELTGINNANTDPHNWLSEDLKKQIEFWKKQYEKEKNRNNSERARMQEELSHLSSELNDRS